MKHYLVTNNGVAEYDGRSYTLSIKPCPVCNEDTYTTLQFISSNPPGYKIGCEKCGCYVCAHEIRDAARLWNTRIKEE